jgi:hypothetical protein
MLHNSCIAIITNWKRIQDNVKAAVKLDVNFNTYQVTKAQREGKTYCSTPSLTSALDSWRVVNPTPRPFYLRERHQLQGSGWAPGPLGTCAENLALTEIRSPDLPTRKESLYQLSYQGPSVHVII